MKTTSDSLTGSISKNIKKYRMMNSMTQQQMAARLFLDTQYYAQLERGERNFTIEKLVLACEVFHVSIDKIIPITIPGEEPDSELISDIHEQLHTLNHSQLLLLKRFISECLPCVD